MVLKHVCRILIPVGALYDLWAPWLVKGGISHPHRHHNPESKIKIQKSDSSFHQPSTASYNEKSTAVEEEEGHVYEYGSENVLFTQRRWYEYVMFLDIFIIVADWHCNIAENLQEGQRGGQSSQWREMWTCLHPH